MLSSELKKVQGSVWLGRSQRVNVLTWLQEFHFHTQPSRSTRYPELSYCEASSLKVNVIMFCLICSYSKHNNHGREEWILKVHKLRKGGNCDWRAGKPHCISHVKRSKNKTIKKQKQKASEGHLMVHWTEMSRGSSSEEVWGHVLYFLLASDNCFSKISNLLSWTVFWKLSSWGCFLHKQTHPQTSDQSPIL